MEARAAWKEWAKENYAGGLVDDGQGLTPEQVEARTAWRANLSEPYGMTGMRQTKDQFDEWAAQNYIGGIDDGVAGQVPQPAGGIKPPPTYDDPVAQARAEMIDAGMKNWQIDRVIGDKIASGELPDTAGYVDPVEHVRAQLPVYDMATEDGVNALKAELVSRGINPENYQAYNVEGDPASALHFAAAATAFTGVGSGLSCLLYTSPSPRDRQKSRMPSSA